MRTALLRRVTVKTCCSRPLAALDGVNRFKGVPVVCSGGPE